MNRKNCDTCGNFDLPICNACIRKYDEPPTKWVPNEQYEPKTNADRIRSMSDEELAELLESFRACSRCLKYGNNCFPVWDALNWLQQPVKEGADRG